MANYTSLKGDIQRDIKQNGENAITGNLLQSSLLAIINSLGVGYQYVGIATPTTNPGTPDQKVLYLAATAGTYTNFGGIVLSDGDVAIIKGSGGTWTKEVTGVATKESVIQLQQILVICRTILGETDSDLCISDEDGNVLLKLYSGNIKTKNFDSRVVLSECDFVGVADLCISDEDGNVLLKLKDGHIQTKNFNSKDPITQSDFHKYHAIGDSITYGTGAMGHQYFTYFQELCGFSVVTSDGVGGREITIRDTVKAALPNIPSDADCVSIFAGTNDWGHHIALGTINDDTTQSTMYGALKYICEWMSENRPTTTMFFITPIQRNCNVWPADNCPQGQWTNNLGLKLDDYVNAIKEVSAFYSFPCLDLFKACFNGHSAEIVTQYMPDGLHPNVAGHRILARKISKFINFKL